jgi:hypothetical protein
MGDVPVPVLCEVDRIVLSPQPLSGAGRPFPQTEIEGVREQGWVNDIKTEVMFNCPILQKFFYPFQAQDNFLIQLRILEIFDVLRVVAALAKDVARNRRD